MMDGAYSQQWRFGQQKDLASAAIQTPDRQDHSIVTKYNSLSPGLQVVL